MFKRSLTAIVAVGLLGLAGRYIYTQFEQDPVCSICHRAIHEGTSFWIHLRDGRTEEVCCPRCGLRFIQGRDDVVEAEAADFESGARLPAGRAFYVEGSSVHPCSRDMAEQDLTGDRYDISWDRCLPSLIAFKSREAAEAFRSEFGGVVKLYGELLEEEP